MIGVIGGSGFYELLSDVEHHDVDTPYGRPSGPVSIGQVAGRPVAFLARHGAGHVLPPHRIPYRANLWALDQLGVDRVVAPCAVGSLKDAIRPGDFVVCDQFVDRTSGRPDTFFDGPHVHHVSTADPYCPELRQAVAGALAEHSRRVHHTGTVVVVQGPRFSTRAESAWYRAAGWDVINMTQYPEATLAREMGMCYSAVALVTDHDTGVDGSDLVEPVSMDEVLAVLAEMVDTVKGVLSSAIAHLPEVPTCDCRRHRGPVDPPQPTD
ncbi:MAG TPA: S-methyl-5'-thioadenosine phosphorylase [Acidimicrobiales bacterium]|jgi:5'-methylthioadenosine phosphorylase|nr:S-methyl-5'-thioadenosine phosphorylase [Acidimicrobiales bacterium]